MNMASWIFKVLKEGVLKSDPPQFSFFLRHKALGKAVESRAF